MPEIIRNGSDRLSVHGDCYELTVLDDETLCLCVEGTDFGEFRAVAAVDGPAEARDVASEMSAPLVEEGEGFVRLTWDTSSTLWESKQCIVECVPEGVTFRVVVEGQGSIGAVEFLSGSNRETEHPSLYRFSRMMTSEVSLLDRRWYKPWEYACIDATSGQTGPFPCPPEDNNHWIFTPPPLALAWARDEGPWLGVGLAPEPGQYNFTRFQHWPVGNCFKLRLTYDGMTSVSGRWESPRLILLPARDEYDAVRRCCNWLYDRGFAERPARLQPGWWSLPIFCGWGQQNMTAAAKGGPGSSYARQESYDSFMAMLEERGINPGTIVIDDKWQSHYATLDVDTAKWPDLRGWIDAQHDMGRHVLLWMGCWSNEGLAPEECITNVQAGNPHCADPTSPAYEERLRSAIRRLLSDEPGCCNADGFKVDWTNGVPMGEGFRLHGNIWGLELLKRLAWIIYDESKKVKPDSLIITHMANPYFAEVTDMLRLNDISAVQRGVPHIMRHRQKLALAACPDWLIDCDNSSAPTREEWLDYMKIQPELGVPSLYFITGVDGTGEAIRPEDWEQVPDAWRR